MEGEGLDWFIKRDYVNVVISVGSEIEWKFDA